MGCDNASSMLTRRSTATSITVMADVLCDLYGEVLVPSRDAGGREIGFLGLRTSEVRFDPCAATSQATDRSVRSLP